MSVMMVRQKVKDGSVEEAEAAARELFATLNRLRPEGLRYASTRVVDGSTFVALVELADGIEDPRPAIPEYLRFLEQLKGWVDGPLVIERLDVVGSYSPDIVYYDVVPPLQFVGAADVRRNFMRWFDEYDGPIGQWLITHEHISMPGTWPLAQPTD